MTRRLQVARTFHRVIKRHNAVDLVFPKLCCVCDREEAFVKDLFCLGCHSEVPFVESGKDAKASLIGKDQLTTEIHGFYTLVYYRPDSISQQIIHKIKYRGRYDIAFKLGQIIGSLMRDKRWYNPVIMPVPLHSKKQITRGFNQAEEIARGIGHKTQIRIRKDILKREINSDSQTGKGREERQANLSNVFYLNEKATTTARTIILVDDVITTGATIQACMSALKEKLDTKIILATIGVSI